MHVQMVSALPATCHSLKLRIKAFSTNGTAGQEAEYGERKKILSGGPGVDTDITLCGPGLITALLR